MLKKIFWLLLAIVGLIIIYFITWPVPIDPVAWTAPPNPGYTGPYEVNERLKRIDTFPIAGKHGPEDISLDAKGRIYAATHEGNII